MLAEGVPREEHERYQNPCSLDLPKSDSVVKYRNVQAHVSGRDKTKECTLVSYSSDKLDLTEEQSRPHRQSLRTSLAGRVLRNRRYRPPFDDHRHTKRLFTPEIKKYLKDWLIRRREHPYPNRDEKKALAVQTGLTYIQICNWFANWRRKLKNAGSEDQRTWSHLIKSYNTQAEGNVEQFSISSDDSIWDRREFIDADDVDDEEDDEASPLSYTANPTAMDHSYSVLYESLNKDCSSVENVVAEEIVVSAPAEDQPQCYTVSSTTTEDEEAHASKTYLLQTPSQESSTSNKYKRHIMEKYMKDLRLDSSTKNFSERSYQRDVVTQRKRKRQRRESDANGNRVVTSEWEKQHSVEDVRGKKKKKKKKKKKEKEMCPPPMPQPKMLSKWLESAEKFQPTKSYVPWNVNKSISWPKKSRRQNIISGDSKLPTPVASHLYWNTKGHQRAELDAAEALTCLSGLH